MWSEDYVVEVTRYEFWDVDYLTDQEMEIYLSTKPLVISYGVTVNKIFFKIIILPIIGILKFSSNLCC